MLCPNSQENAKLKNLFPKKLKNRIAPPSIGYTRRTPLTNSPLPDLQAS